MQFLAFWQVASSQSFHSLGQASRLNRAHICLRSSACPKFATDPTVPLQPQSVPSPLPSLYQFPQTTLGKTIFIARAYKWLKILKLGLKIMLLPQLGQNRVLWTAAKPCPVCPISPLSSKMLSTKGFRSIFTFSKCTVPLNNGQIPR